MTDTTFKVRIWTTEVWKGKTTTTYTVRWKVATKRCKESFKTSTLAESFRSQLVTAAKQGEAFNVITGLPVSMTRKEVVSMSWYAFACRYVDMKWDESAGNSRKGVAETLANATVAMIEDARSRPDDKTIRRALNGWAFNCGRRDSQAPDDVTSALEWIAANTRPVASLGDAAHLRAMMAQISKKLDGKRAAPATIRRKRAVLYNAMEYAVEKELLPANPIPGLKLKVPKPAKAIDKRVVANPSQAAKLLEAVRRQKPSGGRLVAFFATMYFAAARPGEAVNLNIADVSIPKATWDEARQVWQLPEGVKEDGGELVLSESAPETGAAWSETGTRRDRRQLKHREKGDSRSAPCPPQLAVLLRDHIRLFGLDPDGYFFRGHRGTGLMSESTYSRVWRKVRKEVLSDEEYASPLARRAYDLRHAAVSTYLAAGIPPQQVAEWAGHSLEVLFKIYAKCLAGQEDVARKRLTNAFKVD
ncbi:tyrosine-type recombinase/integrase [Actinokineospora terrae]|uniref:Site-specific recombinase XerD n=1 Tax=Actinokineospora terrae TaxID=155974 RepID=A0A1H9VGY9_9PSEU|nr:site-specific integrase [Actinokineospora terrae]SES20543.1 Site-specific recombinase XerD [Actinokineospora terrae]